MSKAGAAGILGPVNASALARKSGDPARMRAAREQLGDHELHQAERRRVDAELAKLEPVELPGTEPKPVSTKRSSRRRPAPRVVRPRGIAGRAYRDTGIPAAARSTSRAVLEIFGWGLGLSLMYLLLTKPKAVELASSGIAHGVRNLVSPKVDPLNPKFAHTTARAVTTGTAAVAEGIDTLLDPATSDPEAAIASTTAGPIAAGVTAAQLAAGRRPKLITTPRRPK